MKNKININESVHYSVKNRKRFKAKMWLIFLAFVVILLACGVCFTFGTVTWDPDQGFEPKANVEYWWQALLVAVGAVLAVSDIVFYFLINYWIFKSFYKTQEAYWKTAEFKKAKAKATKMDLYKLKAKDLKWYKKMGYINSEQLRSIKEQQKTWIKNSKQENQKINYAESKA